MKVDQTFIDFALSALCRRLRTSEAGGPSQRPATFSTVIVPAVRISQNSAAGG